MPICERVCTRVCVRVRVRCIDNTLLNISAKRSLQPERQHS